MKLKELRFYMDAKMVSGNPITIKEKDVEGRFIECNELWLWIVHQQRQFGMNSDKILELLLEEIE